MPSGTWAALVAQESGAQNARLRCSIVFGGSGTTKGFFEQDTLVAAEIAGLVDEGYLVVVLPNGQKWGRRSVVIRAVSHLDTDTRAHVRVAPDPAESDAKPRGWYCRNDRRFRTPTGSCACSSIASRNTPTWSSPSRAGWRIFASILGRPFRLFLAAGSYSSEYHPRDRSTRPAARHRSRRGACAPYSDSALLRDGDPPPCHTDRGSLCSRWRCPGSALGGGAESAVAALRDARQPRCRRADVGGESRWACGPCGSEQGRLLAALQDRSPQVVREAADALLREGVDCGRELGARYREVLQAHADIVRHNWDAVASAGNVALPALFKAAACDNKEVEQGAKDLIRDLLSPFVSKLAPTVPRTASS